MKLVKPNPYLPTEKHIYTQLKYLSSGDRFAFVKPNGARVGTYFVEGQYPKFKCTTVININNIHQNDKDSFYTKDVTAVENDQVVFLLKKNDIKTFHKIFAEPGSVTRVTEDDADYSLDYPNHY